VLGGAADAATTQPFFGAALGVRIGALELDVEAGHFNDILPKGVLSALNDLQRQRGLPVQGIAAVPAEYAIGGLRIIPGVGPFRPFVSAGAGAARLRPRIDVVADGLSLGDIFGLTSFAPETKPMAVVGAGLRLDGGAVHLEGGYRYVAVFSDFHPPDPASGRVLTHVNCVYGAIGARF
jgi:hypothetical protein